MKTLRFCGRLWDYIKGLDNEREVCIWDALFWRDVSRVMETSRDTHAATLRQQPPNFLLLRFHRCPSSSNQMPFYSERRSYYVLISGIPGRYGLRRAKQKVFLSLFTSNSYSPCFRMARSGQFSTRMGSWFRLRDSSEFLISTPINFWYISSCQTVNTDIRGTRSKRAQKCVYHRLCENTAMLLWFSCALSDDRSTYANDPVCKFPSGL